MKVLYHLTTPEPGTPEFDAVVQEVEALRGRVGGELIYVNPTRSPGSRFPERLYGLHCLFDLRGREAGVDLHHLYNAHLYVFPYLRWLRRPVIYSVAAGLRSTVLPRHVDRLNALARIVINNVRDLATLRGCGLRNIEMIRPGIDLARFTPSSPPADRPFTLLMGSAPWTIAQFESKGINALLVVAQARPDLRLVFLWRGLHIGDIERRIAQAGVSERITVINRQVDVNEVLLRVHAAIVLADSPTLVKAYPHSLLEALAVGRPVLISRAIPMADYVTQTGCGQVVEAVSAESVSSAIAQLEANYEAYRATALQVGRRDFSQQTSIEAYLRLYTSIMKR